MVAAISSSPSAVVTLSFYVRKRIGARVWRVLHLTTLLAYAGALLHAALLGTDSSAFGVRLYYYATTGVALFLLLFRIGSAFGERSTRRRVTVD